MSMRVHEPALVPPVELTPRWPHDCQACRFLGSVMLNQRYDVYYCTYGAFGGTMLARYGPEGPDYASFDTHVFQMMVMLDFRATVFSTGEITHEISPWMKAVLVVALQQFAGERR